MTNHDVSGVAPSSVRGGGLGTRVSWQFAAIMAAAMMLAVVLVPLAGQAGVPGQQILQTTGDGQGQDITYHYGSGDDRSVTVHYDGIAATEYNPEFWNGSVTGVSSQPANWVGPETTISVIPFERTISSWSLSSRTLTLIVPDEVTVKLISGNMSFNENTNTLTADASLRERSATLKFSGSVSVNKVFAGWSTTDDDTLDYYPGDVVPSSVTDLYAVWAEPNIYVYGLSSYFSGNVTWDVTFETYRTITSSSIDLEVDRVHTPQDSDKMFVDIMVLGNNISSDNSITTTGPCTIRSSNGSNITFATISLGGDTIFDNISLTSNRDPTNHGDNSSSGIFANGHKLILGTGIGTEARQGDRLRGHRIHHPARSGNVRTGAQRSLLQSGRRRGERTHRQQQRPSSHISFHIHGAEGRGGPRYRGRRVRFRSG